MSKEEVKKGPGEEDQGADTEQAVADSEGAELQSQQQEGSWNPFGKKTETSATYITKFKTQTDFIFDDDPKKTTGYFGTKEKKPLKVILKSLYDEYYKKMMDGVLEFATEKQLDKDVINMFKRALQALAEKKRIDQAAPPYYYPKEGSEEKSKSVISQMVVYDTKGVKEAGDGAAMKDHKPKRLPILIYDPCIFELENRVKPSFDVENFHTIIQEKIENYELVGLLCTDLHDSAILYEKKIQGGGKYVGGGSRSLKQVLDILNSELGDRYPDEKMLENIKNGKEREKKEKTESITSSISDRVHIRNSLVSLDSLDSLDDTEERTKKFKSIISRLVEGYEGGGSFYSYKRKDYLKIIIEYYATKQGLMTRKDNYEKMTKVEQIFPYLDEKDTIYKDLNQIKYRIEDRIAERERDRERRKEEMLGEIYLSQETYKKLKEYKDEIEKEKEKEEERRYTNMNTNPNNKKFYFVDIIGEELKLFKKQIIITNKIDDLGESTTILIKHISNYFEKKKQIKDVLDSFEIDIPDQNKTEFKLELISQHLKYDGLLKTEEYLNEEGKNDKLYFAEFLNEIDKEPVKEGIKQLLKKEDIKYEHVKSENTSTYVSMKKGIARQLFSQKEGEGKADSDDHQVGEANSGEEGEEGVKSNKSIIGKIRGFANQLSSNKETDETKIAGEAAEETVSEDILLKYILNYGVWKEKSKSSSHDDRLFMIEPKTMIYLLNGTPTDGLIDLEMFLSINYTQKKAATTWSSAEDAKLISMKTEKKEKFEINKKEFSYNDYEYEVTGQEPQENLFQQSEWYIEYKKTKISQQKGGQSKNTTAKKKKSKRNKSKRNKSKKNK